MSIIERILNAFGYFKKQKERIILITYNIYLDGGNDIYGNVWCSTDKTGIELLHEVFKKTKTTVLKEHPDLSEDQCPTILISSITYLD